MVQCQKILVKQEILTDGKYEGSVSTAIHFM
jgi:hypothetical protein